MVQRVAKAPLPELPSRAPFTPLWLELGHMVIAKSISDRERRWLGPFGIYPRDTREKTGHSNAIKVLCQDGKV